MGSVTAQATNAENEVLSITPERVASPESSKLFGYPVLGGQRAHRNAETRRPAGLFPTWLSTRAFSNLAFGTAKTTNDARRAILGEDGEEGAGNRSEWKEVLSYVGPHEEPGEPGQEHSQVGLVNLVRSLVNLVSSWLAQRQICDFRSPWRLRGYRRKRDRQ